MLRCCSGQLASPTSISSALHRGLQPWRSRHELCWSLPEAALAQKKKMGYFHPKQWKRQKIQQGERTKRNLKFKLPGMSFFVITSVLILGLVLWEHLVPWSGFLQNLSLTGEGKQLLVPYVEALFGGWGHLGCFRQKLPRYCYHLLTTNSFLLMLAQPPIPHKQNQIFNFFFKEPCWIQVELPGIPGLFPLSSPFASPSFSS